MTIPPGVRVRRATPADDRALNQLDAIAWSAESGFPSAQATPGASFFDDRNPPEIHLVAEVDGEVAGYIRLKPPTTLPENQHVIQISGLAVAPAKRQRGIAAALLAAAEAQVTAAGAGKLSLRVFGSNERAIRLYQRAGFEREGTLRGEFLINGAFVDDVLMAKALRAGSGS